MADLYMGYYRMNRRIKALYDLEDGMRERIPATLDDPRHYDYTEWIPIKTGFNPENIKDWLEIGRILRMPAGILIHRELFVNPLNKKHPKPRHPIGYTGKTVYWLRETDEMGRTRTVDIRIAKKAWREAFERNMQMPEEIKDAFLGRKYEDTLRRPRVTAQKPMDTEELRKIKDEYGFVIKPMEQPCAKWDEKAISRVRNRSWKEKGKTDTVQKAKKQNRQYGQRRERIGKRCSETETDTEENTIPRNDTPRTYA